MPGSLHCPCRPCQAVALLIGNTGYAREKPLANPVRDARLLAQVLKDDLKCDDVELTENADRARLHPGYVLMTNASPTDAGHPRGRGRRRPGQAGKTEAVCCHPLAGPGLPVTLPRSS